MKIKKFFPFLLILMVTFMLNINVFAATITINSISNLNITVNQGDQYTLPKNVVATYSNNSKKSVAVTWSPRVASTKVAGKFKYTGTVKGYSKKVILTLTVKQVKPSAPENVTAVTVDDHVIDIQWDPVDGADYYYLYERTYGTDQWLNFEDDYGNEKQFTWYDDDYSVEVTTHDDIRVLEYCVVAVKNGVESDLSEPVTAINQHTAQTFDEIKDVPMPDIDYDDVQYSDDGTIVYYVYDNVPEEFDVYYAKLLEQYGYQYYDTVDKGDKGIVTGYVNGDDYLMVQHLDSEVIIFAYIR